MADLHVVYTGYGDEFGWAISSPQIPELIGGRNTLQELVDDTSEILQFAGVNDGDFDQVWVHEQHVYLDPSGDEYLIRFAHEDDNEVDNEARRMCASLTLSCVEAGFDEDKKARQPRLVTTERLMIAALGHDTIGWCLDQLDAGTSAVVVQQIADDATHAVAIGETVPDEVTWELEDLGLTRKDTVTSMFDAVYAWEARGLAGARQHTVIVPV
ncbi:hypothetical protein [Rhodococcus sp. YH1]|uniref:hypothetical protein n=1 Tax=Rhodococcus sp. YH1 TaxID=89066 RepID=UPI001386ADAF|nr:hypothetical protein [Rhodococcus sp. YH1]